MWGATSNFLVNFSQFLALKKVFYVTPTTVEKSREPRKDGKKCWSFSLSRLSTFKSERENNLERRLGALEFNTQLQVGGTAKDSIEILDMIIKIFLQIQNFILNFQELLRSSISSWKNHVTKFSVPLFFVLSTAYIEDTPLKVEFLQFL